MTYKVSILALVIGAGLSSGAFAQDFNNSGVVVNNTVTSPAINLVAIDSSGAPVDTNMVNPDGTFKSNTNCPCAWVNPAILSQAQRDVIAADHNAAVFDSKTSKIITATADTYTGDAHVVSRTLAGVKTGEAYGNAAGDGTAITAGGVASVDASGNATLLTAKGVGSADASGNVTVLTAKGVAATNANGDASAFTANGVTVVNTAGASSAVTAGGASFTDAGGGNTTIAGGNVTNSGDTTTHGKTTTGSLDVKGNAKVGGSLDVSGPVYGGSMYTGTFSGNAITGGSAEIGNALNAYGSNLSSLNAWQDVAKSQIANLQGDVKKLQGGVALAMASKVPSLETGKTFGITANFADVDGTGAISGGLAFRIDKNWQVNASGGTGFSGGASGGSVGIVGQW